MADLGTDAGQASLNLSAKALELLAKIIDRIFKFIENSPARRKARLEYKIAKSHEERETALRKISGKAGYMKYKIMKRTGRQLLNTEMNLSKEDMKLFADIAKRYDLTFTGMKKNDSDLKEIVIFRDELAIFERLQDRFVKEKMLREIQSEIKPYEDKGIENLTEDELKKYESLKAQKEHIIDEATNSFNEEMNKTILKDAVLDENGNLKGMDLTEGLNRLTGYGLSTPESGDFVIADGLNSDNYIKVHGFDDSFINEKGEKIDYVRSQYEVYKNNELVKTFDDKRYVGRPKDYWTSIRNEMKDLLGNPRFFYKFKTEDAYRAWAEDFKTQNKKELMNNTIESLKNELLEKGFDYKDGNAVRVGTAEDGSKKYEPINKERIKDIIGKENLPLEDKLNVTEAYLIGQTIESIKNVSELETKLDDKNAEIVVEEDATKKAGLQEEYDALKKKLNAEKENIEAIKKDRMKVNAAQAERNVFNGKDKDKSEKLRNDHDEHLNENEQTFAQQTPDDWKNEINKERLEQAAKNNDMGTKGQTMEHVNTAARETVGKTRD